MWQSGHAHALNRMPLPLPATASGRREGAPATKTAKATKPAKADDAVTAAADQDTLKKKDSAGKRATAVPHAATHAALHTQRLLLGVTPHTPSIVHGRGALCLLYPAGCQD